MSTPTEITFSIVVPTYRRPDSIMRCLESCEQQTRAPLEIVVVTRQAGDDQTTQVVGEWVLARGRCTRRWIMVTRPGQNAAVEAGVRASLGAVVVTFDDDVVVATDWLERAARHYNETRVVGVGGRDYIFEQGRAVYTAPSREVGKLTWYGRIAGRHHAGEGSARAVDHLKGCNLSIRREYWRFTAAIRGSGFQAYGDTFVSLMARRHGTLIYDPHCTVEHHVAARFDADPRGTASAAAIKDQAHNEVFTILRYLRWWQRPCYVLYTALVGHRANWGLLRWVFAVLRGEPVQFFQQVVPSYQGKAAGVHSWVAESRRRHTPATQTVAMRSER